LKGKFHPYSPDYSTPHGSLARQAKGYRALLHFDKNHEILDFKGIYDIKASPAIFRPSVVKPSMDSDAGFLQTSLRRGYTYISVDPMSDFPVIGIMDAEHFQLENGLPKYKFYQKMYKVGYEPVLIEEPIDQLMVFPPTSRYFLGLTRDADSYSIGGYADYLTSSCTQNQFDFFRWKVQLNFGAQPPFYRTDYDLTYRFYNHCAITGAAVVGDASATGLSVLGTLHLPALYFGANTASVACYCETDPTSAAIARYALYGYYWGFYTNYDNVNITSFPKRFSTGLTPGNYIKAEIELQTTGSTAERAFINANVILEVQDGGW